MNQHEPGTRTEDLGAIQPAPPGSQPTDRHLRCWGRRNYITGITLAIADVVAALVMAMLAEDKAFTDPDGRLFANLTCIIIMALAAGLIVAGAQQTITANSLTAIAATRTDTARNRRRLDQLNDEVHELAAQTRAAINRLADTIDARGEQLGPIIEALPAGLAATVLRLNNLEEAMGAVAEHLPDALQTEHWRGFNAAVRQGLTDQRTGTDGPNRRRPPTIGLVPPGPER